MNAEAYYIEKSQIMQRYDYIWPHPGIIRTAQTSRTQGKHRRNDDMIHFGAENRYSGGASVFCMFLK